jgi:transcription initiation factor IIE alpha subunit
MRTFDNGIWTSELAAEQAETFKASVVKRVFDYLVSQGGQGATDQEIEEATGIAGNTERPARLALEKDGLIKRTRRWRLTRSRRKALVWEVVRPK